MMRYSTRILGGTLLALSVGACNNFLTGEGVDSDPNNPTEATTNQLFVASEAALMALQEGPVAIFSCLAIQHCGGVGNFVETWGATYEITSDDFNPDMLQVYVGGGLLDLRTIQERALADNNRPYAGMAKVIEALQVSFAADNFGDVPYSESITDNLAPKFDNQLAVYAALQTLLDGAITDLGQAGGGPNPSGVDLFYGGDKSQWIQAAYTLKARLYLHMVEAYRVDPANATNQSAAQVATLYASARDAALQGISTRANDFRSPHTSATSERNLWFQFSLSTFGQYLKAGQTLIDVMNRASRAGDRRLTGLPAERYFSDADQLTGGDQFVGVDLQASSLPTNLSEVGTSTGASRITDSFRQPILTYDETQLILAEAYSQLGNPGLATTAINNVRGFYGAPLLGVATLQDIAEEQYVTYFQNIEAWQSYKRFCYPNLDNAPETSKIPFRLFYGTTETNTNPNTPTTADQGSRGGAANDQPDAFPDANRNDPPGGFINPSTSCFGTTEATPGS